MADRNIRALYPSCKPVTIYGLIDPRDRSLKYIGKSETPELRCRHHVWESPKNDSPKSRWIRELIALGFAPELLIIETVEAGGDWAEAEKRHIALHRANLFNQCSGGQGVPSDGRGEKWRNALAASHVDNPKRADGAKRAAEKLRGRQPSKEVIEKRAAGSRGRKLSPEHCAKIGARSRGHKYSAEVILRMSAGQKGRKHTAESNERRRQTMLLKRESQAERQRNNWRDPEYRARVQANMKGNDPSPQTRLKLAQTSKSTWSDPTVREKRTAGIRAAMRTPEWSAKRSEIAKKLWSDPEFRARMKAARSK